MLELVFQSFAVQYDTLGDFLDAGGWVTRWILAACAVLITVALERAWYLWRVYPKVRAAALAQWKGRSERQSWIAQRVRIALISQLRAVGQAPGAKVWMAPVVER